VNGLATHSPIAALAQLTVPVLAEHYEKKEKHSRKAKSEAGADSEGRNHVRLPKD